MKLKFWQEQKSIYDEPIEKVLLEMKEAGSDSPQFAEQLALLERLASMKEKTKSIMKVSPDTVAIVAGNLLGILIIVAYEQKHPMTSKGLNYIKPKNP